MRFSKRNRTEEIKKAIHLREIVVATTGKVGGQAGGQKIVGFIHGIIHCDPISAGPLLFLTSFYVKPGFRRRALGSRLLDFIIEQSIKRSRIVGVEVSTVRKYALEFYKARGFEQFQGDFGEVLLGLDVKKWCPRFRSE